MTNKYQLIVADNITANKLKQDILLVNKSITVTTKRLGTGEYQVSASIEDLPTLDDRMGVEKPLQAVFSTYQNSRIGEMKMRTIIRGI